MQRNFLMIIVGFALLICQTQAAIIRVPADQPTIQDGIDAAVHGDTVLVADGVYTGNGNRDIDFKGKAIEVVSENGFEFTIIDCDAIVSDRHRGFYFHSDETNQSKLDGFTVINGVHSSGAAIYCANASPLISNCMFENNIASQKGGAIYCDNSVVNLLSCIFVNNSASDGGGACFVDSDLVVLECKFLDNIAKLNGGGINCASSGGIFIDCVIAGNTTIETNGTGGGVYCSSSNYTLTFILCDIIGNSTATYGGGFYFKSCGNMSSISLCNIWENIANLGGGIYFSENADPIVGGDERLANFFDNNTATCGVDMCTVSGRSTVINAGYNHFTGYHLSHFYVAPQGSFDLTGCRSSLTPIEQDVYIAPDGDDNNDGLTSNTPFKTLLHANRYIYGSESNPLTIHLAPGEYSVAATGESIPMQLINHTIIKGESAETTTVDGKGAGPVVFGFGVISTIEGLTVTGGVSESLGGGINCLDADVTVNDCIIRENPPEGSSETDKGGGISAVNSSLTVANSLIEHNGIGNNGSGVFFTKSGAKSDLALTMSGCTVSENYSSGNGGGVNIISSSSSSHALTVDIDNCTIKDNSAYNGGGVYISGGGYSEIIRVDIDDCIIQGNVARNNGGGVSCSISNPNGFLLIQNSTIQNNQLISQSSVGYGGGLYINNDSDGIIHNCLVKDNLISGGSSSDGTGGGGIYFHSEKTGIIQNCVVQGNRVEKGSSNYSGNGGGIYFSSEKDGLIQNCVIRDNTAEKYGGVCQSVYADGYNNKLTNRIINCTIVGNTANNSHGGVFVSNSASHSYTRPVFDICNTIIRNNNPGQIGIGDPEKLTVKTTFCNVSGGFPGHGNIDQDPRFASAADCHLRSDSPCIDAGTDRFVTNLDCDLNPRLQGGEYDMGAYEYAGWPNLIRVNPGMPLHYFGAGDTCSCEATVWNPGTTTISGHPLFVVISLYGEYFFAPSFTDFDYFSRDYPPGQTTVTVLPAFTWPDIDGAADDILWIAVLTDPGITQIYGAPGFFVFGWY